MLDSFFLLGFIQAHSPAERYGLLFAPHNEHLIVFPRLITLVSYKLTGSLNFQLLQLIGLLAIPLSLLVLYKNSVKGQDEFVLGFLPVVLVLCAPVTVDALLWPTAALTMLWVFLFCLLALQTAEWGGIKGVLAGLFFGVLGVLTLGNGVLIFLALLFSALKARQFTKAAFWLGVFLLISICLLPSLQPSGILPHPDLTFRGILKLINFAVSLVGSGFGFNRHDLSLVCGTVLIICSLLLLKGNKGTNRVFYGLLIFSLLSAAVHTLFRSPLGFELAYAEPRYRVISLFILSALYLLYLDRPKGNPRRIVPDAIFYAVPFFVLALYLTWEQFTLRRDLLQDARDAYADTGKIALFANPPLAEELLMEARKLGIYRTPNVMPAKPLARLTDIPEMKATHDMVGNLDWFFKGENFYDFRGWAGLKSGSLSSDELYLVFKDKAGESLLLKPELRMRPDVTANMATVDFDSSGFFARISKVDLPAEITAIGAAVRREGKFSYLPLQRPKSD